MKIKFLILSLSLLAATCGADQEKKTPETPEVELNSSGMNCEKSPVPDLDDLNKMARLNFNLADNCNFQPVHIVVREENNSSELIARFNGEKIDEDTFRIDSIEFKNYEILSKSRRIIVDTVYLSPEQETGVTKLLVELINLNDCSQHGERLEQKCLKKQYKKHDTLKIDHVFIADFTMKKGSVLDLKIENDKDIYGDGFVPRGEQCKGNTMF